MTCSHQLFILIHWLVSHEFETITSSSVPALSFTKHVCEYIICIQWLNLFVTCLLIIVKSISTNSPTPTNICCWLNHYELPTMFFKSLNAQDTKSNITLLTWLHFDLPFLSVVFIYVESCNLSNSSSLKVLMWAAFFITSTAVGCLYLPCVSLKCVIPSGLQMPKQSLLCQYNVHPSLLLPLSSFRHIQGAPIHSLLPKMSVTTLFVSSDCTFCNAPSYYP